MTLIKKEYQQADGTKTTEYATTGGKVFMRHHTKEETDFQDNLKPELHENEQHNFLVLCSRLKKLGCTIETQPQPKAKPKALVYKDGTLLFTAICEDKWNLFGNFSEQSKEVQDLLFKADTHLLLP